MLNLKNYGPREWVQLVVVLLLAAAVPLASSWLQQPYYLTLVTRIMIFALAAAGLNLALGFGGMVSFGHAMYLGIGAYAVGILSKHGISEAWLHIGVALMAGAIFALPIGWVCLRTTGMAFIMITLAFAQMAYFVAISLKHYGGEDGLSLSARSTVAGLDMSDGLVFYVSVLTLLMAVLWLMHRLVHARFGVALQGTHMNERRMAAMGFAVFRYRLLGYLLSAEICVLAGVLLANLTRFVSPSYMQWSMSGELIVMVALGGMGTVMGPIVGAASMIMLEELLTSVHLASLPLLDRLLADHWLAGVGLFVIFVTLRMHRGLLGSLRSSREGA